MINWHPNSTKNSYLVFGIKTQNAGILKIAIFSFLFRINIEAGLKVPSEPFPLKGLYVNRKSPFFFAAVVAAAFISLQPENRSKQHAI